MRAGRFPFGDFPVRRFVAGRGGGLLNISLMVAGVLILAGVLALEAGITSAITEIVAGVLLAYFLPNVSTLEWLEFLAHFGVLGLMFLAGFEVDVRRLRTTWKASVGMGVVSLAVPMAGVFLLCTYALGMGTKVSGLIGVGLSTTSLALVYNSLKERDLLKERVGQIILGAASVVDVLSMVALALLLGDVGWGTGAFLIFMIPTVLGLPRIGEWIFRRYKGNVVEFELRFILMVLVGLGFLAEKAGVHQAVVAFTVGLILSEVVEEHEQVEEKLKGVVFSFFAPIFFLHAGTRIDLGMADAGVLGLMAVFFAVACGLKYLGTMAAARAFLNTMGHFSGILFNYRLTFGIIAATVGLEHGLLDRRMYAVLLLVVLASAILPMIFLRERPTELSR